MTRKFDLMDLEEHVAFFLEVSPCRPGAQDTFAMENRTYLMDALYDMDGRDNPAHPFHHTYTGLYQKYVKQA
jgi:hypothetical protein